MRDPKMWSLTKFERFHIGGWGMEFYKQHCYMFQVTHKVKQIKRLVTSSVKNNRIHTSEAANQFSDCRMTNYCPIIMGGFARSSRICGWAGRSLICFWSLYHTCACKINMRGGSGRSIHPINFALSVIMENTSPARKGVSVHKHKVLVHVTSIRVANALLISSR